MQTKPGIVAGEKGFLHMTWSEAERKAAWRKANPQKFKEEMQRYYIKHKQEILVKVREWKKRNPKKVKVIRKRWVKNNPFYYQEYYRKNKGVIIGQIKSWQERNSDHIKEYNEKNEEHIKERKRKWYLRNREMVEQDRSNKIKNTESTK